MMEETFFSLADLYLAYRKAKVEAFYESTHFHALAFTNYEQDLHKNLLALLGRLRDPGSNWSSDTSFLGGFAYAPKSISDFADGEGGLHYRAINPIEEWKNQFVRGGRVRAEASFRLVITGAVDFHIISALWILKIGHYFDARLDPETTYGNRLRRHRPKLGGFDFELGELNTDCLGLFPPYFSAYRNWREKGLNRMRRALGNGEHIVAITMDVRRFYHNIDPKFLVKPLFQRALGLSLTTVEEEFNSSFVTALETWYRQTPDCRSRPEGAIPVGLSASKVIANVLLHEFDRAIVQHLMPVYYGRYVDDVFLVLKKVDGLNTGSDVLRWMATTIGPFARYSEDKGGESALRLRFPYAARSDLVFTGSKQKMFDLSGDHGLDLVEHICDQIRRQSSEHRLLSELPDTNIEMAARALLATPDATLAADALRKADTVSVRRLGFALLLGDIEGYERDLRPSAWRKLRNEFYGLVSRHLLTPKGFFDYSAYLHRIFGIMVSCGDFEEANKLVDQLENLVKLLTATTTAGTGERSKFKHCLRYYANAFSQAALRASTVIRFSDWKRLGILLKRLSKIGNVTPPKTTTQALKKLSDRLLYADWGRRSYKDYWFYSQRYHLPGPPVPRATSVKRLLRLGGIRKFRVAAELRMPFWPALAFPTRPLSVPEIGLIAPQTLNDSQRLRDAIMALRGAKVVSDAELGKTPPGLESDEVCEFIVPDNSRRGVRVALTSVETKNEQWAAAATGRPDRSLKRYRALRCLINRILVETPRAKYVVFPECSVPRRWAVGISSKLAQNRMSFLAGLEYYYDRKRRKIRNDCLISLTTSWPGYPSSVLCLQPKLVPAHHEREELRGLGRNTLYEPLGRDAELPVYVHGDLCFGVLLCSDLTNISNRKRFQGQIDALFVLEWNPDVKTFSFLVEAAAHDVHAFVVQVNNRQYGDSRIRAPYREEHRRDAVQVKGGISDYYVLSNVEYQSLRAYQRLRKPPKTGEFKPAPIGFSMSQRRRVSTSKKLLS